MIAVFLSQLWVQRLGWTLVHFLWQGTAIAGLYAAVRGALGRSLSAQGRYILACLALGTMTAVPPLTFLLISDASSVPDWWNVAAAGWQNILPIVVVVWLLGVIAFSIRMAAGWRFTVRLRTASHPAPQEWQQVVQRTAARVGASRPVRLLVSSLAEVPMVIGWLRPVILVPVGSLAGLPLEHMTALLAHELAHIRRHDYLASVLQNVAESLLFYHPAVWWVSQRIRTERELCCDDLAVSACGDVVTYARALAELESQRPPRLSPVPAANGGSLVNRVRRLTDPSQAAADNLPGPGVAWAMSLLWIAGIGVAMTHASQVNNDRIMFLRTAPQAILYDPFLPSPEALSSKYGKPHTVLPNGSELLRPAPGTLSSKYGNLHNVLRGGTEVLRQDATYAPLPQYPPPSLRAGNRGLVVIEVVVSPEGRVRESLILASFDRESSATVTAALNAWRFHSIQELSEIFENSKNCEDCIRIGRLGFEFQLASGKGSVVDLAAAEVGRRGLASPFLKKTH